MYRVGSRRFPSHTAAVACAENASSLAAVSGEARPETAGRGRPHGALYQAHTAAAPARLARGGPKDLVMPQSSLSSPHQAWPVACRMNREKWTVMNILSF